MNIPSKSALICLAVVGFGLTACAEPPEQDLTSARSTLETAKAASAEEWAGDEWQQAQDAMNAVDEELATQASKMGLMRSYKHTAELVTVAQQKAEAARTAADANKEAARSKAAEALADLTESAVSAQRYSEQLPLCPKKPKGFEADMAVVTGNLDALRLEIDKVQGLYDTGAYAAATEEAVALAAQFDTQASDLLGVMDKIGCAPAPAEEEAGGEA